MRTRLTLAAPAMLCIALAFPQFAESSTFINFNVTPVNGNVGLPTAINKWGTIVGYYSTDGGYDGYLWKTNGSVTTIVFPKMMITKAMGINDSGSVVGFYQSRTGAAIHGFLRNPEFATLDAPFAGTSGGQGTEPLAVNDAGEIAGVYWDSNSVEHGFILDPAGNYTSFDAPGGTAIISAYLNQNGEVAGTYLGPEPNLEPGGYLLSASGSITTIEVAGALYTQVYGINSSGEIAGQYLGAGGLYYGFVQNSSGAITTFSVSGLQIVAGIADSGNIYGMSRTTTKDRGWKYTAAGVLSYFADPSAGPLGTLPVCVASSDRVAGIYWDSSSDAQDFEMSE